jgi:hypothetical protein
MNAAVVVHDACRARRSIDAQYNTENRRYVPPAYACSSVV